MEVCAAWERTFLSFLLLSAASGGGDSDRWVDCEVRDDGQVDRLDCGHNAAAAAADFHEKYFLNQPVLMRVSREDLGAIGLGRTLKRQLLSSEDRLMVKTIIMPSAHGEMPRERRDLGGKRSPFGRHLPLGRFIENWMGRGCEAGSRLWEEPYVFLITDLGAENGYTSDYHRSQQRRIEKEKHPVHPTVSMERLGMRWPSPFEEHKDLYSSCVGYIGLGGHRTGLSFHKHGDAWTFVAHGKKLWSLRKGNATASFVQRPGELLYLPQGWEHSTTNIGDTVSFTANCKEIPTVQKEASSSEGGELRGSLETSFAIALLAAAAGAALAGASGWSIFGRKSKNQ